MIFTGDGCSDDSLTAYTGTNTVKTWVRNNQVYDTSLPSDYEEKRELGVYDPLDDVFYY